MEPMPAAGLVPDDLPVLTQQSQPRADQPQISFLAIDDDGMQRRVVVGNFTVGPDLVRGRLPVPGHIRSRRVLRIFARQQPQPRGLLAGQADANARTEEPAGQEEI